MDEEEWRSVIGYEGLYEVSTLGRVRSLDRVQILAESHYRPSHARKRSGTILKPHINMWGYPQVNLQKQGHRKNWRVHTLVCTAFHGERPLGLECAHNDGDHANARADNLRWATREANRADQLRHGTRAAGQRNGSAKLTIEQVRAIRADTTSTNGRLAEIHGVSDSTISVIRRMKAWNTPGFY